MAQTVSTFAQPSTLPSSRRRLLSLGASVPLEHAPRNNEPIITANIATCFMIVLPFFRSLLDKLFPRRADLARPSIEETGR
jgi:hypothetical protein